MNIANLDNTMKRVRSVKHNKSAVLQIDEMKVPFTGLRKFHRFVAKAESKGATVSYAKDSGFLSTTFYRLEITGTVKVLDEAMEFIRSIQR